MVHLKRVSAPVALLALVMLAAGLAWSQTSNAALTEEKIVKLIDLNVDDAAISSVLQKQGINSAADDAVIERLKKAGATEAVLIAMHEKQAASNPNVEITDFAIILDCLASMGENTKERPSKMTVAKRAVTDLIQKIPDERAAPAEITRAGKGQYYNARSAAEFRELVRTFHKKLDDDEPRRCAGCHE
jgi:hypothetical protein